MSKKEIVETLKVEPRANFSSSTIEKLYKSNGGLCSRCGRMTTAYNHENLKYISIGEAGHIFGAKRTSDKSPRSNSTLTNDFLKNFENGIWLCKNCHKLIDDAEKDFSSDLLLKMKKKASSLAYDSLKRGIEFYELIQNDKYLINSVDFGTSYSSTEINGIKILNSVSLKGYDIYDDYHDIKSKSKLFKCSKELKQYYRKVYEELSEVHL